MIPARLLAEAEDLLVRRIAGKAFLVRRSAEPARQRRHGELKIPSGLAVLALLLTACSANTSGADTGTPSTQPSAQSSAPATAPATAPSSARIDAKGLPPCTTPQPATSAAKRGLPDVTLDCLVDGQQVKLSDLRGKPLLVNVWAQWCGPCRKEAPYLAELAKKANGRIALLGVDIADPRPDLAIDFASEHGWTYPHLRDPDKLLLQPLKLIGPPATAFVSPDGELEYVHLGPFTSTAQLEKQLHDILGVTL